MLPFKQETSEFFFHNFLNKNFLNNKTFKLKLNRMGSGTNANVFLILYGEKGQSGKLKLKQSTTNKDAFEKGKTDVFKVISPNIGNITKINISHDGSGAGSGWFCETIEVTNSANKQQTY